MLTNLYIFPICIKVFLETPKGDNNINISMEIYLLENQN